ncbi:MAG TPA: PKD domain-containing protein [Bacillota bacterium]|nr:PKD domain-containing protein [Bacillota bacterium]
MKKQKSPARSAKRPGTTHKKRAPATSRPLHKRVLLHPFSVMVLLCVGVLLAGSTYKALAGSYDLTATVPAPLPTGPAVITSISDQQHVSSTPITLNGTCPPQSYVKLYRNAAFSGVAQCSAGQVFQIQTALSNGANQLQAKVFNATDTEGPQSSALTIFYDQTVLPPPTSPASGSAIALGVSGVEAGLYKNGSVSDSSAWPTITGWAPPFSDVVVTFHSDVVTCKTKADASGNWRCTLGSALPVGVHHVDVVATTTDGQELVMPSFQINVLASLVSQLKQALKPTLLIGAEYHYQIYRVDQPASFRVSVNSDNGPYKVSVDWGDGDHSELSEPDSSFTVTHNFRTPNTYVVMFTVTDQAGVTSTIQMSAVIKGRLASAVALTTISGPTTLGGALIAWVRHWLWIIWPAYLAVILMAASFWLGEQESYREAINRRMLRRASPRKK